MLFLGSFPPPRAKWSMEFFYPNFINDFWRVWGLLCYDDKTHFERGKTFDKSAIEAFATEKGMAFFDTASQVRRLKGNASDDFLEIVEPTDIGSLLAEIPDCYTLVTTGGKASDTLLQTLSDACADMSLRAPAIGTYCEVVAYDRTLKWYRMPSTSRAYPMSLEKKAAFYSSLLPLLRG